MYTVSLQSTAADEYPTGAPTASRHKRLPWGLIAYTAPSAEPTNTVPCRPTAGDDKTAEKVQYRHSKPPPPPRAYTHPAAFVAYTVPSVTIATLLRISPPVGWRHLRAPEGWREYTWVSEDPK